MQSRWPLAAGSILSGATPFYGPTVTCFGCCSAWIIWSILFSQLERPRAICPNSIRKILLCPVSILFCVGALLAYVNACSANLSPMSSDVIGTHYFTLQQFRYFGSYLIPILLSPLFFAWTLPNSTYAVRAIQLTMLVIVGYIGAILLCGTPDLRHAGNAGWYEIYTFLGQPISMVRTQVGPLLALCSLSAFTIILNVPKLSNAIFSALILPFSVSILAWCGSRTGMLITVIIAVVLLVAHFVRRQTIQRSLLLIVFVSIVATTLTHAFPDVVEMTYRNRWDARTATGLSLNGDRAEHWLSGLSTLAEEPFGRGWNLVIYTNGAVDFAHNDYLSFAIGYGFIGGIAYLLSILLALKYNFFHINHLDGNARAVAMTSLVTAFGLGIASFFDIPSANITRYTLCWFLVSIGQMMRRTDIPMHLLNRTKSSG